MKSARKKHLFWVLLGALPACSLFVSLDDLQDGGASAGDASTNDAPFEAGAAKDASSDSSSGFDAGTDAESGVFMDDFNRPDSPSIGNGWTMKMPAAFTLSGTEVERTTDMTTNFADDIVYRPASEDVADVDVSIEFKFQGAPGGYPQLHVRAQRSTITQAAFLDSYVCYMGDASTVYVSRAYDFTNVQDLGSATISAAMLTGDRYRIHCHVTGAGPVTVVGTLDHLVGADWQTVGVATGQDADAGVMAGPGSVGFSASSTDSSQYVYDNFIRTNL